MAALTSPLSTHEPQFSTSSICLGAPFSNPHPVALLQTSRLKKRPKSLSSGPKRPRRAARVLSLWTQIPNSPFRKPEEIAPIELEPIKSEDEFNSALAEAQQRSKPIIVDWMAAWCRKCIYLKPKLEKLASEFKADVKFYAVDVNTVPQALVKRADVTKMPTIQLWKNGEKCDEVIGGHKAWLVVDEVREMLQKHLS